MEIMDILWKACRIQDFIIAGIDKYESKYDPENKSEVQWADEIQI